MRVALAQINPVLGAFKENAQKIMEMIDRAHAKKAQICVFSELTLFGYPPNDALEQEGLVEAQLAELKKIISRAPKSMTVVLGCITQNKNKTGKPFHNSAAVISNGKAKFTHKMLLPTYDIFDEGRFFEAGKSLLQVSVPKVGKVTILICEDMWGEGLLDFNYPVDPLKQAKKSDLVINISASPYALGHHRLRIKAAQKWVKKTKSPFVYVNQVGGQDEAVFDGKSFVIHKSTKVLTQASSFEEDLLLVDIEQNRFEVRPEESDLESLRKALVLGIKDFVQKNGLSQVHLGISGGIDSALVAALAVDALGPSKVVGILLPGPFSSEHSKSDALKLANNLRIKTETVSINSMFDESKNTLASWVEKDSSGLTSQNLQARLRGLTLMAYSNSHGSMLLNTSNKSELAAGYSTLYGDLCGGLCVIGDLTKGQVYALSKHYNQEREVIPQNIFDKAPSAELAPNQKDQDTLPPYDELDKSVEKLVTQKKKAITQTDLWLKKALAKSEFKRWQAPPVLRVSDHAFGRGRRHPITRR